MECLLRHPVDNMVRLRSHGFFHQFRPEPLMRNNVYRFDPDTSAVRVVATDFNHPNGIAFTKDGKIAYVYVVSYTSPVPSLYD